MLTPLVLLFGLTVATAVIAYWSDNLGKKLGKKRVSLLGLRPRTTATLLTIASSWGIMLFTLAVLLTVWSPLRDALLRYQDLLQDTRKLEVQLAQQDLAVAHSESRLNKAQDGLKQVQGNLVKVQRQLTSTKQSLGQARKGETTARRGEAAATRQAKNAAREARSASERATAASQRLTKTQSKLDVTLAQFKDAEVALDREKQQLVTVNSRLVSAQKSLSEAKRLYRVAFAEQQKAQRASQVALKTKEIARKAAQDVGKRLIQSTKVLAETEARLAEAEAKLTEAEARLMDARQLVAVRQAEAASFLADNLKFARGEIRVNIGRTIAERLFPPQQSEEQARVALLDLVKQGEADLPLIAGPKAKLSILEQLVQEPSGIRRLLNESEVITAAARYIAGLNKDVSVRVTAARNFLASEERIDVRFVVVPAEVVYPAGATILEATVDGREGDAKIFKALYNLIEEGRQEAESKGVSAPQSPTAPDFYAAGTTELLFEALRRVSATKRQVPVRLVAASTQTSAEPLKVKFEVG